MNTLVVYINVQDLPDPEFCRLLDRILTLPEAQGRLKFNVFDQTRAEVAAHADKLYEGK